MTPLEQVLLQRQQNQQAPQAQPQGAPLPQAMPNPHPKMAPEAQRWSNSQQIQDAYRNNWSPNPVLLRAVLGGHQ